MVTIGKVILIGDPTTSTRLETGGTKQQTSRKLKREPFSVLQGKAATLLRAQKSFSLFISIFPSLLPPESLLGEIDPDINYYEGEIPGEYYWIGNESATKASVASCLARTNDGPVVIAQRVIKRSESEDIFSDRGDDQFASFFFERERKLNKLAREIAGLNKWGERVCVDFDEGTQELQDLSSRIIEKAMKTFGSHRFDVAICETIAAAGRQNQKATFRFEPFAVNLAVDIASRLPLFHYIKEIQIEGQMHDPVILREIILATLFCTKYVCQTAVNMQGMTSTPSKPRILSGNPVVKKLVRALNQQVKILYDLSKWEIFEKGGVTKLVAPALSSAG